MFGSAYVSVVGYYDGDAGIYCRKCAEKLEGAGVNIHGETWSAIHRYEVQGGEDGDRCETCGELLEDC